jgi:cytochrome c-type biogenesis protein CcmH/NrfF
MKSPYDQLNQEIKSLIRQGCSAKEATQQLTNRYPSLVREAAKVLKHVQAVEREMRKSGQ